MDRACGVLDGQNRKHLTFSVKEDVFMGSAMGLVAILISLLVFFAVAAVIIAVVIHIAKKNKQISGNRHRYICPKC